MKILYAIQGTGNGHVSRARDIIPILQKKGDLDILVSGIQADVDLPYSIKYKFKGLSFIFGKKGGIDLYDTFKKCDLRNLIREIKSLPVHDYDLIISDFEPVSTWACKIKKKPCIGLSHQSAVINKNAPKPKTFDIIGNLVLRYYAPFAKAYGFHFENYDENIFPPVIRNQIRSANPVKNAHYTVYLPAYGDEIIIRILNEIPQVNWEVFSKHSKVKYNEKNVQIRPIQNEAFITSIVNCTGILCGAGFESPAEALFLQKKLMVIPMKGQYEQQCNAAALNKLGVPVLKSFKLDYLNQIKNWVDLPQNISVNYPDITEQIINKLIADNIK